MDSATQKLYNKTSAFIAAEKGTLRCMICGAPRDNYSMLCERHYNDFGEWRNERGEHGSYWRYLAENWDELCPIRLIDKGMVVYRR